MFPPACIKLNENFLNLFSNDPKVLTTLFLKLFSSKYENISRKYLRFMSTIINSSDFNFEKISFIFNLILFSSSIDLNEKSVKFS